MSRPGSIPVPEQAVASLDQMSAVSDQFLSAKWRKVLAGACGLLLLVAGENATATQAEQAENFDRTYPGLQLEDLTSAQVIDYTDDNGQRDSVSEILLDDLSEEEQKIVDAIPEITATGERTGGLFDWFGRFFHFRKLTRGDLGGDFTDYVVTDDPFWPTAGPLPFQRGASISQPRAIDVHSSSVGATECETVFLEGEPYGDEGDKSSVDDVVWGVDGRVYDREGIDFEFDSGEQRITVCFTPDDFNDRGSRRIVVQERQ